MKRSILDRVRVVSPCGEDWREMRGSDEVRFCSHCAKDVHNLSGMTRRDAERLIAKSNGRVCVRYVSRADKKILTASELRPLHNITRRASRLAAGAFTAALTLTTAAAQNVNTTEHALTNIVNVGVASDESNAPQIPFGGATLTGTITDPTGAVVSGAKVVVTNESGAVRVTHTDDDGNYKVESLPDGLFKVKVEGGNGFVPTEALNVSVSSQEKRHLETSLEIGGTTMTVGMLIAVSPAQPFVKHYDKREALEESEAEGARPEPSQHVEAWLNAASWDELKDVKRMLREGTWIDERNEWGETALMLGAQHKRVVKALLRVGANVHARSEFGVTPLMYAMLADDDAAARLLIDAGADVNARDDDARTALMFAAMEGRVEIIKRLLAAGAEISSLDRDGKSALQFAREFNQEAAIEALTAAGGRE